MRKYFYDASPLMKNWLEAQYNLTKSQDKYFRDALLASLKLYIASNKNSIDYQQQISTLRETILDMTIEQQDKYANNSHLESLFKLFEVLHRNSRGRNMIYRGTKTETRDIVDPDKFPIWDLKQMKNVFYSRWEDIGGSLRYDYGHQLVVGDSLVEHPDGGRGVFTVLKKGKDRIYPGEMIGLVPGIIYDSYKNYRLGRLNAIKSYEIIPQHLNFPSGKVLEFSDIPFQIDPFSSSQSQDFFEKSPRIQPQYINPYALGHMINHPPVGKQANVIFTEITLPKTFFPNYLHSSYLPYFAFLLNQAGKKETTKTIFAVMATKQIKSYEQLYVNYCENHIYPIDRIPEWMVEPPANSLVDLQKGEYQQPTKSYWQWLQRKALKKNKQLYEKYKSTIRRTPGKIIHEDSTRVIKQMKMNTDS